MSAGREAGGEVAGRRAISCVCATPGLPQTPCNAACADCCDRQALSGAAPSLTGVAAGLGLCRGSGAAGRQLLILLTFSQARAAAAGACKRVGSPRHHSLEATGARRAWHRAVCMVCCLVV